MIPQNELDAAKKAPVAGVWGQLGLPEIPHHGLMCSPFRQDNHASLQVGGERNIIFDHSTKEQLDTIELVRKVKGCSLPDAVAFINGRAVPETRHQSKGEAKKPWATQQQALAELAKLPLVADVPELVQYFAQEYGLVAIPKEWRAFEHPTCGMGICYPGHGVDNSLVAVKWKSLKRGGNGKRDCRFLFGSGGFQKYQHDHAQDWIIVNGEEKVACARSLGFSALGGLTGERSPGAEVCERFAQHVTGRVLLCNDADDPGNKANIETAADLLKSGFPAARLYLMNWQGRNGGYDLCDWAKDFPFANIWDFAEAVPEGPKPKSICFREFMDIDRPPLRFLISDILPERGKMLITGDAKGCKSWFCELLSLCLACGHDFVGFRITRPTRVLMIQSELSDQMMEDRYEKMMRTAGPGIRADLVGENLFVFQCEGGAPVLSTPEGKREIEAEIDRVKPECVIFDPFYHLFPGIEENEAGAVGAALRYLSDFTARGLSVILTHHHGKGGASRGSSVFAGWPESDMAIKPEGTDYLKLSGAFRCCSGETFPKYMQRFTNNDAWFHEVDEETATSGSKARGEAREENHGAKRVVDILAAQEGRAMRYSELVRALQDYLHAGERTVKRYISQAKEKKMIDTVSGLFFLPGEKPEIGAKMVGTFCAK